MKLKLNILLTFFTLVGTSPIYAGTVIDCARACGSCERDQICYCDPGDGYLCLDKKAQGVVLDLETILEEEAADLSQF